MALIRAYDRAAIKFRGVEADINFKLSDYEEDMKQVEFDWNKQLLVVLVECECIDIGIGIGIGIGMMQTKKLSKEEFVQILRRHSTGFSRGTSKYRGVTLHKCGRWEARMGQFLGKK